MKPSYSVMCVFGTRPEAIKMAPIINELEVRGIPHTVCVTGQHREMLHQMLALFDIKPDYDLDIMTDNQTLEDVTARVLGGLGQIYRKVRPSLVLVQGDTTSAFAAALAAFYEKIPVGHVEAGLRTNNMYDPFPEEMARRLLTRVASVHFAPTQHTLNTLLAEGVDPESIHATGNTVIDALLAITGQDRPFESEELRALKLDELAKHKRIVVVTAHRRENFGDRMQNIFSAIAKLAHEFRDVEFVFPVHPNPNVGKQARSVLDGISNVALVSAVDYSDMAKLLKLCYAVLTDSGGLQEEAPALDKPVLVLRETTERGEGVDAGTAILAGAESAEMIYTLAKRLLTDDQLYNSMAKAPNPYGDGSASRNIVDWIEALHRGVVKDEMNHA